MKWIIVAAIIFAIGTLLRSRKGAPHAETARLSAAPTAGLIKGPGKFSYDVRGEFAYQPALRAMVGKNASEGFERAVIATLVHEDDNEHDALAIRVDIDRECVGHLGRDDARAYWMATEPIEYAVKARFARADYATLCSWTSSVTVGMAFASAIVTV